MKKASHEYNLAGIADLTTLAMLAVRVQAAIGELMSHRSGLRPFRRFQLGRGLVADYETSTLNFKAIPDFLPKHL